MKAFISLSPKRGTFNTVLDELIKMGLSKKDVFLLFGPVDILVQIREIKNLNEFINKWFNPIVEIKSQEPMIEKTQTHIVISEGNAYDEEPTAFLFLNAPPRNLKLVQKELQSIPNVLSADTIFGPYDVICAVTASTNEDLKKLVSEIQDKVPQILGTATAIVASIY
jgi:hypothetical protein